MSWRALARGQSSAERCLQTGGHSCSPYVDLQRTAGPKLEKEVFPQGAAFLELCSRWSPGGYPPDILSQTRGPSVAHLYTTCVSFSRIMCVLAAFVSAEHLKPKEALFSKPRFLLRFSRDVTDCLSPLLKPKAPSGLRDVRWLSLGSTARVCVQR